MTEHRPSALELQLKRIVRPHPDAVIHPHSPSGPYVRAVLWTALEDENILGQAFWDTDTNRWVVRAKDLRVGESSLVVEHPDDMAGLAPAISRVIQAVRGDGFLSALPPTLAATLRSLRNGT